MREHHSSRVRLTFALTLGVVLTAAACSREPDTKANDAQKSTPTKSNDHGHDHDHGDGHGHGDGHDHGHGEGMSGGHHHGPSIELGQVSVSPWTIIATRDEGPVTPGGDIAVDIILMRMADEDIDPSQADAPPPTTVRLWIGSEDGRGALKVLADLEKDGATKEWHAHVEVPDPLPPDAKIWAELEGAGRTTLLSFSLSH
ncbi:MAG: hypothetical protein KF724_06425 [Phycisphaeraceae bacterium]|nr:hypothetical protein [Phycisphaeraceae bacterium]